VSPRIFRVLIRVPDIARAVAFYDLVLDIAHRRISNGRAAYECGDVELVCYDPAADGDLHDIAQSPSFWQLYIAVDDLEAYEERVRASAGRVAQSIQTRPWGERSFYAADPFGNRLCFVDTRSTGSRA